MSSIVQSLRVQTAGNMSAPALLNSVSGDAPASAAAAGANAVSKITAGAAVMAAEVVRAEMARATDAARLGRNPVPGALLHRTSNDLSKDQLHGVITSLTVSEEAKNAIMATLSTLKRPGALEQAEPWKSRLKPHHESLQLLDVDSAAAPLLRPHLVRSRLVQSVQKGSAVTSEHTYRVHGEALHEGPVKELIQFTIEAFHSNGERIGGEQFIVTIRGVARARARVVDHGDGSCTLSLRSNVSCPVPRISYLAQHARAHYVELLPCMLLVSQILFSGPQQCLASTK